jgi:hypothetical protein
VLLPLTVTAVPIWVPPLVHTLGAVACGPNTLKVTVPPAPLAAPDSADPIALAGIAVLAVPAVGPAAVVAVGVFCTTVEFIALPQGLVEARLPASPL